MKARFALLAVALPLLALAGEGLYYAARSRRQLAMTCDEFVRQKPRAAWVRLTNCTLDYDAPGYQERDGRVQEIFFPVRLAGQPRTAPAPLLAATRDPAALALVQGTIGNGRQPDQETLTVMMLRVVTLLRAAREIEGRTRSTLVERLVARRALASFQTPLDDGYRVIDLHRRPEVLVPAVEGGAGLLAILLFLLAGRRRRAPAVVASGEGLPAMLLLNLEPSAGLEAIEHAPPLGTRDEVSHRLRQTLLGIRFDPNGHATMAHTDVTLDLDLGTSDPVWTVVVRANGPAATEALHQLSAHTGWRLYVPRRGTFI